MRISSDRFPFGCLQMGTWFCCCNIKPIGQSFSACGFAWMRPGASRFDPMPSIARIMSVEIKDFGQIATINVSTSARNCGNLFTWRDEEAECMVKSRACLLVALAFLLCSQ
jgi:hypothetical protein